MIAVLENKDFIEGIFTSRKEAEEYYSSHPEPQSCRMIELPFEAFPLYVLEEGRGNFKYFENKKSLIAFLKELDLNSVPQSTAVVFYAFDDAAQNYEEKITVPSLTVYFIQEPYRSYVINEDGIGILVHYHFDYESLEEVIKTESLMSIGME